MHAILFQLNKTQEQQSEINRLIYCENVSRLKVFPIPMSKNIKIIQFDLKGRANTKILTPCGKTLNKL